MNAYFAKMKGTTKSPPRVNLPEIAWSWLGSFLGIGFISFANYRVFERIDLLMIVGSFGASAVLIYGAIKSPLAQPRNLLGGHVFSALVGVASQQIFSSTPWFAAALAVSTAIALMHATRTLHPPGGATALIAIIGGEKIHNLGYLYALFPWAGGADHARDCPAGEQHPEAATLSGVLALIFAAREALRDGVSHHG